MTHSCHCKCQESRRCGVQEGKGGGEQECVDAAQTGPAHSGQSSSTKLYQSAEPHSAAEHNCCQQMELNRTKELLKQMKLIISPHPTK